MLVCTVGYGCKNINGQYLIEKECMVLPDLAESFNIEKGTKVVIFYKGDGYTTGNVLDVREENISFKERMEKDYIIDVVDFSVSNRFERLKSEYRLLQDIADAVKRYNDYSDYSSCKINIENHYNLDSCEQTVTLNFSSPIDPTGIFYDTFYKEDSDFNDEE